jgi:hypothetical protein
MGVLDGRKFKPALFVGLGGNGGKIVNLLAGRLRRHPNWKRIEAITHFIAIDTNKDDLDKHREIRVENRFLVSAFDARAYVDRKRGNRELPEDPLVTQWIPADYAFRQTQGAGAGQIRMESRLRLYYNLEEDRARIRQTIDGILQQSTRREDPWRDNDDRVVRIFLFGSVAGGTGSGGFLPMAYLLRQMVEDAGWGRPNVTGVLTLPTAFLEKVKPQLHGDICANGYAALKELEYLTRQLDYAGGTGELEFHFDPGARERDRQVVDQRPFNLVYLVDRPDQISIDKYEHAVADAIYLQVYSPLLGAQEGEYDNYEKHQKQLALGHFSVHYGAFGTALLHLPRRDLLSYAVRKYVARAFRDFLCFGADEPAFRIPYGDPAFERLDPRVKAKQIDDKFREYVAYRATGEEQANELGVFWGIERQMGKGDKPLPVAFREKLEAIFQQLNELIDIPEVERQSINPTNPSLDRALTTLRQEYGKSQGRVRTFLETQRNLITTGRFFPEFFREHEVNPIAQRLFLLRLLDAPFLTPYEDPAEGEYLRQELPPVDLEGTELQQLFGRLNQELAAKAQQGFFARLTDRENAAFQAVKKRAVGKLSELAQELREELRRHFWKSFEADLRRTAETTLDSFRKVAEIADDRARDLESGAESFRRDPAAVDPDSDVAQYYLDAEVLRDDRRKERLWDVFAAHKLGKSALFDTKAIFATVTGSFQPQRDSDGRLRSPDASEIIRTVRRDLEALARGKLAAELEDMGLDLPSGLDLEQRYILLRDEGKDLFALHREGKLDDAVKAVDEGRVLRGVEDRLKRLAEECVLLAHLDRTRKDDTTVTPAEVLLAGLHPDFNSDEEHSLGKLLRRVTGATFAEGWMERDAMVLYRATLGIPVYWFKNVEAKLYPAYKRVRDDPHRSYPLHIEARWEGSGLPDLDPVELKRAEERRRAEEAAARERAEREARIRGFTLCSLAGAIARDEGGTWVWSLGETKMRLAADRGAAFLAFEAIDPRLRQDLEDQGRRNFALGTSDRANRARFLEDVKAHERRLREAFAAAYAAGKDQEKHFLEDERAVVEQLIRELEA